MEIIKIISFLLSLITTTLAQDFCYSSSHTGQSVLVNGNRVGNIGGVGYEMWADSGYNSATFYSDGSFSCTFNNAKDYLCRTGLSFDSSKTHGQIGHMYADFRLIKQNIYNVDYSYVGIYGWTRGPLVEFYIVDNWLSQYRPGDWVGNRKLGDFYIDGAMYTVFENTRYGPSIDGDTYFKQYFSIRQQARDCGTIDITAHFQQWESLGMQMGRLHEAKVLGEAGSNGYGTSGTADFPYAKVYINNNYNNNNSGAAVNYAVSNAVSNDVAIDYKLSDPTKDTDYCTSSSHDGQSVKETENKSGKVGEINYELWADGGYNSATFYPNGSFTCNFSDTMNYLCRSGLSFDSTKTHSEIGHLFGKFRLVKKDISNVDYSFVGVYGWSKNPLIEFFIVDNWLGQWRPDDWVGNKKYGDYNIDGAKYTVYENSKYGPSIEGDTSFKQFFSIRQEARDCGTIDITAHFKRWEKLGMTLGKLHEAKIFGEAGSNGSGASGTADFPYARVFIDNNAKEAKDKDEDEVDEVVPVNNATAPKDSQCKSSSHSGQNIKETSNKAGEIGDVGYELWADGGNNSATFYSDGSFTCNFSGTMNYLCRAGLSFDSTKTHSQIGHLYAEFTLVKKDVSNVDYSFVGVYGWSKSPLTEFFIVDNWLGQWRPDDWVGDVKHGDYTIDGAKYTVYENTKYGPSIEGDTYFKQYFSIRKEARECGKIDITAHFKQWEDLGMTLGKLHEAKIFVEAGSNESGTSGSADFPYAKVYYEKTKESESSVPVNNATSNNQNFCYSSSHTGQSIWTNSNRVGNIGGVGYEMWADSGYNTATFYSDGSFSCNFSNAKDYLCRSGLSFDSSRTHDQIGHMFADFRLIKQNISNVDYSYVGIYGWTRGPLVEFYIVDNWLSQYRPGDWVGNRKYGDYNIDGAQYTIFENGRYGPSIDGDTYFKQYFSIRQQARDCGTIDITAHFQQWERLGMQMGRLHEAKVLGEAGSNGYGTSGNVDFPYAKVYINNNYKRDSNRDNSTDADDSSEGKSCAPLWGRCGGMGFDKRCCAEGTCKKLSPYYHQCQK